MLRDEALEIVRRLQASGHQALFAGGCIRDRLLAFDPTDYDVATSARPHEVESLFENTIPVGKRFGIMVVPWKGHDFEVATFRSDGVYLDGRRPEEVTFSSAEEDARRRDFTINAMFEDPVSGEVIDYVGGKNDLEHRLVRAVGDPLARFREDRLRMMRAVRFAARLDFEIEDATLAAIEAESEAVGEVSAERIGGELVRILTEGSARRGFELLDATGLLAAVMPEMKALKGCRQPDNFHPEGDVFEHTLVCLGLLEANCSPTLALGLLLHDIEKPSCRRERDGRISFHGHTKVGAQTAETICRRLRLSNAVVERVSFLVAQHLRHCSAPQMRQSTLKRFLRQNGIEELLELTRLDALASDGNLDSYEFCRRAIDNLPTEEVRPPRLVTGEDLKSMGLAPGPLFKRILTAVEDAQLEGYVTTREQAVELIRQRYLRSDQSEQM